VKKMAKLGKVSVILPAYNEEKALAKVVREVIKVMRGSKFKFEVVITDDGSKDRTFEIAKNLAREFREVKAFTHGVNKGKVAAVKTCVSKASGEVIVIMDADYTYPARFIPEMLEKVSEGYDMVLGNRFGLDTSMSKTHRLGNDFFSAVISLVSGVEIRDVQTGFRAFRKEMFQEMELTAKRFEYETEQTIKAAKRGYRICEIPIEYRERLGESKLNGFSDGLKIMIAIIKFALLETLRGGAGRKR